MTFGKFRRAALTGALLTGTLLGLNGTAFAVDATCGYSTQCTHPWESYLSKSMYQGLLNRAPDESGLNWWLSSTANLPCGQAGAADIAAGFAGSGEFSGSGLSVPDQVERMYAGILRRPSDFAGKAYWVDAMNRGVSAADAARAFVNSAEFSADVLPALCPADSDDGGDSGGIKPY